MRAKSYCLLSVWLIALLSIAGLAAAADDLRLVEAVKRHDRQEVVELLKQKADVKTTQPDGATALHWAVHRDELDIADLLIRAGADVNAANVYGVTPLSLACTNGSAAMIGRLLKAGASVDAAFPNGQTALMTAARTGRVDAVRILMDHGAEVNTTEPSRGQTALMWAAGQGHTAVVKALLERGANVRARSKTGYTPLLFAVRTGDLDLVKILLDAGANVNEAAADDNTALVVATVRSHITLARFLLEQGANPNKGPGFTPLHWAVGEWGGEQPAGTLKSEGDEWSTLEGLKGPTKAEFVQLLLGHGADPNARADGNPPRYGAGRARGVLAAGATPFFFAAKAGDETVMRLLVTAGADPLLTTNLKMTPLIIAAGGRVRGSTHVTEKEALKAIRLCVELGNDVNAADEGGETALHAAAGRGMAGSTSIVQFLVDKGARVNVKDQFGWTPLAVAEGIYFGGTDTRNDKTAELLRKLGAEPTPPDVERDGAIAELKVKYSDYR